MRISRTPMLVALFAATLSLTPLAASDHTGECATSHTTIETAAGTFYVVTDGNLRDDCLYAHVEVWEECNGQAAWQHNATDQPRDCRFL